MSDHGFRPITHVANIDVVLKRLGLAADARMAGANRAVRRSAVYRAIRATRLGQRVKRRLRSPATLDWGRTTAYQSTTGGGVSVNLKGREPHGRVESSDLDNVVAEIGERLLSFQDPRTGQRPVGRIVRRSDLPPGPYADLAPDIILWPADRWGLTYTESLSAPTTWPTGTHRLEGILACSDALSPETLGTRHITDLAPTALAFRGLASPGMDGHAIEPIAGRVVGAPVSLESPKTRPAARSGMTEAEGEEIAQHLRDLGYLE
jgi:predicted AlkP superfamily phosphohydrolase/phosphomutase